jgi:hypothetical protein
MNAISRPQFDALPPIERRKFISAGGAVADPEPVPPEPVKDRSVLTRKEFDALPDPERLEAIRAGRRIVDGERGTHN